MPQIKQYEQQIAPSGAQSMQRASAEDFGSGVAQATSGLGDAVTKIGNQVDERLAQDDVSKVDANVAAAQNRLGLKYQDDLQKGTLNHDDFMEGVNDEMDAIGQTIKTRAGQLRFNQMQASTQLKFSQEAQHGQAQIAGDRAVDDVTQASNDRASFVYNNPARFQQLLADQNQSIDDKVALHGLPASEAPKLKRMLMDGLASNAVRGLAKQDPDEAARQLSDGNWDPYLSENARQRLDTDVKQQKQATLQDQARAQKLAQDAATATQEATVSGFLQKMHGAGPGVSSNDVLYALQTNKIDSSTAEHMWKALDSENNDKKLRSDPGVMNDLTRKLSLPDGDPNKITDSAEITKHLGRDISIPDGNLLMGLLAEKHTPQGDADYKSEQNARGEVRSQLIKNELLPDPKGLSINTDVQSQMSQYALEAAKNGKSKFQIWSKTIGYGENAKPNPDYVGNHVAVPHRTLDDIMNDTYGNIDGTAPAKPQDEMVSATAINGQPVRLPKSKVDAARKAGKIK